MLNGKKFAFPRTSGISLWVFIPEYSACVGRQTGDFLKTGGKAGNNPHNAPSSKRDKEMLSKSQFRNCPGCGRQVHISTMSCPHCGARKKLRWYHWVGLGLLALVVLAGFTGRQGEHTSSASEHKNTVSTGNLQSNREKPETQKKFEHVVQSYSSQFLKAKNELQQSALRKKRRDSLADLDQGMIISGWVGVIKNMTTTSQGQAAVNITLANGLEVRTWDNQLSDFGSNTLIDPYHPIYKALMEMSKGQKIKFSGSFFPSEEDYFEETSVTIRGSMTNPEFLIRLSAIRHLK